MTVSDQLVWGCVNDWSAAQKKQRGGGHQHEIRFSSEKGNLTNISSYKASGFANAKTMDLSLSDKKITFSVKTKKNAKLPKKLYSTVPANKGFRRVVNTIETQGVTNFYRADLRSAALARWTILSRAAKVEKGILKKASMRRPISRIMSPSLAAAAAARWPSASVV